MQVIQEKVQLGVQLSLCLASSSIALHNSWQLHYTLCYWLHSRIYAMTFSVPYRSPHGLAEESGGGGAGKRDILYI